MLDLPFSALQAILRKFRIHFTNSVSSNFCVLIPLLVFLAGCQEISGPRNVPEHSSYRYSSDCSSQATWSVTAPGSIRDPALNSVSIDWGAGEAVSTITSNCNGNRTLVNVNVVDIIIRDTRIRGGSIVPSGQTDERFNFTTYASQSGVSVYADVEVLGPGAEFITVGFVHILSEFSSIATYLDQTALRLTYDIEPPWLDVPPFSRRDRHWYSGIEHRGKFVAYPTPASNSIVENDSPEGYWLRKNFNDSSITSAEIEKRFDWYICATTNEAPNNCVIRAIAHWSIEGHMVIEPEPGQRQLTGSITVPRSREFTLTDANPTPALFTNFFLNAPIANNQISNFTWIAVP